VQRQIALPLCAILIVSPLWARQHHRYSRISVSSTALSFNGSTGNASSQPLTITAAGRTSVTVQKLSFSNASFSGSSSSLPITLSPGQTFTVTVHAQPASTAQQGTLTITSTANDPAVSLTETATVKPPTSHSVSLTWKAPAGTDAVDSYQVERAAAGSSQYSVVGTTAAASTTYSDTSVQSGKSYLYEVRAVDDRGVSSAPSNSITLTIP
jgi:predicted phage tail protein